ncbi:MAG: ethanolamine permease [Elusimicrobia bacterium]|nr:ethanolamine permease [Elusimicrobiota bacterium]
MEQHPVVGHQEKGSQLKKALGPWMLWGLGVGYVIGGEYFGWNLGLPVGGTYGMLAATLIVTVMYLTFVFSYTELACAIPKAGGVFDYGLRALGPYGGFLSGLVQVIEFVFALPAVAFAIGAYLSVYFPALKPGWIGAALYLIFTLLNIWGVKQAASFELVVTVLAVAELLIFMAVTAPAFQWEHFSANPLPNGWMGVFASLPFAIWFYLAIEGVANAAEEAHNPQRNVPLGFGSAIVTLVALALGVFFCSVGVAGWEAVVYSAPGAAPSDSPLPLAMAHVIPRGSPLYGMLVGIGLLGLIASFNGIILAASRATMELGRVGFAPWFLGKTHPRLKTPVAALLANLSLGMAAILTGKTSEIITLSCFGAIALYILSMVSLIALRRKEPHLHRPFRALAYPWSPLTTIGIAVVCLVSMTCYYPAVAAVFGAMLTLGTFYFVLAIRPALATPARQVP